MRKIAYQTFAVLLLLACRKNYQQPAPREVAEGAGIEISQLKLRCPLSNSFYRFGKGDTSLYATVTMDEVSGNLYKQVFIVGDDGAAMLVKLLNSGGLFIGDRIRINLNDCWLVSANNMLYLDSIDIEKSVVKISSGHKLVPLVSSIDKITAITNPQHSSSMQSQLVELNGVEFAWSARNKPFANAVGKTALEYDLLDCKGNKISVRTSGMSNFASKPVPEGSGKLIGIVQQYNNGMSLLIRNYNELQMRGSVCTGEPADTSGKKYLWKDFNDKSLTSGGWLSAITTGTTAWTCSDFGQQSYYARIYNKNGTVYEACEAWLISPPMDLEQTQMPVLSFVTANSSTVSPLSLLITTQYHEGSPADTEWTELAYGIQKNSFTYFKSGEIPLDAYKAKNVRIAFRYRGTSTSGSIWNLDDVMVKEK